MVEHPDTEQLARLQQPLRDIDIVVAGNEYATGVVVCDYDRGSSFPKRITEDLHFTVENGTISISILKKYLGYTISFIVAN